MQRRTTVTAAATDLAAEAKSTVSDILKDPASLQSEVAELQDSVMEQMKEAQSEVKVITFNAIHEFRDTLGDQVKVGLNAWASWMLRSVGISL